MLSIILSSKGTTVQTTGAERGFPTSASSAMTADEQNYDELGNVRIVTTEQGNWVTLDAEFVAPPALEALSDWLLHAAPQRTCVRIKRANSTENTLCASPQHAGSFIFQKLPSIDLVRARQYISAPLCDRDHAVIPGWMRDGLAYWRQRGQWFDFLRDSDLDPLTAIFNGRYLIFQVTSDRGHVLHHAGPGYLVHSPILTFASRERGTPVLALHDAYFAAMTQDSYSDASNAFTATADRADTLVDWPGFGRHRHQYWRLMLPYREAGKDWLIVASRIDRTVDLRAPA